MSYPCPVCFFEEMPYPPEDYNICPCCGTEFGNDDVEFSFEALRYRWLMNGALWFFGDAPAGWSAAAQLAKANFGTHTEVSMTSTRLNRASIRDVRDLELQLA